MACAGAPISSWRGWVRLLCLLTLVGLLGSGAAAGVAGSTRATTEPSHNRMRVIPFPGTPDASPSSEIIFSTLKPSDLAWVSVLGSLTGKHTGHVVALPDHGGTAFLVDHPFRAGEVVAVVAQVRSQASAAAAGGAGGSLTLKWSFTTAVSHPTHTDFDSTRGRGPTQFFQSRPDLHPPPVSVTQDRDPGSGDIFLTPNHRNQPAAMILDPRGRLVWFEPRSLPVYNLEVQRYQGHPVLTWWEGHWLGPGHDVIVNRSYRTVARVYAGEGYSSDLHEFQLTPRGTALVDIYSPVRANLSALGARADGTVLDCIIQEVDVRTGRVLWEWHALGHVPLWASHAAVPHDSSPFDYFHINSIQQLPGGNLLISSRSTWAVYEISRRTGDVVWTLGGRDSSFKMGPGANFEWQHDARLQPNGTLTVFDDADAPQEESQSSAKTLSINTHAMTVSLVHRFTHAPRLLASLAGSAQALPNHDVFVGWGSAPAFSEYTPSGRLVLGGRLPYGVYSYRAYRFPWVGHPSTQPAVAASAAPGGRTVIYASWNGATQVAFWRVLGGAAPRTLSQLGPPVPTRGFETAIRRPSRHPYWEVQALDRARHILGTSPAQVMPSGG